MVARFVRSGVWIHVFQFLQCPVKMAPDLCLSERLGSPFVCGRGNQFPLVNELLEQLSNRRVKVNLPKAVGCLEPVFNLAVTDLLLDANGQEGEKESLSQQGVEIPAIVSDIETGLVSDLIKAVHFSENPTFG
jgi:hypothetical protein